VIAAGAGLLREGLRGLPSRGDDSFNLMARLAHGSGQHRIQGRVPPANRIVSVAAIWTMPVAAWQSATSAELWRPDLSALLAPQVHGMWVCDFDVELVQLSFGEVIWVFLFGHVWPRERQIYSRSRRKPCGSPHRAITQLAPRIWEVGASIMDRKNTVVKR
jgi:hypothetical protein